MQTVITENGQYIITAAEAMQALGIPSTASLQSVSYDSNSGNITFIAVEQISNTGSP